MTIFIPRFSFFDSSQAHLGHGQNLGHGCLLLGPVEAKVEALVPAWPKTLALLARQRAKCFGEGKEGEEGKFLPPKTGIDAP